MKSHTIAFALLSLTACLDTQDPAAPSGDEPSRAIVEEAIGLPPLRQITISADTPPALLLYREGSNGPWRSATQVTPQTFRARVRGPFTVLAVCPDLQFPFTQLISRTPEDGSVDVLCLFPDFSQVRQVAGSMVQPGSVSVGERRVSSTAANWTFQTDVLPGIVDVVASSADRVAVRRQIDATSDVTLPTIDLAQEGTALLPTPLTLTNPVPGERSEAVVFLMTPGTQPQAQISRGAPATVKIAPDSVLAAGEDQEVSVRSTFNDGIVSILRSTRRPIHSGGNSVFTLRELLSNPQYTVDRRGNLVARWSAHSQLDFLIYSINDAAGRGLSVDLSPRWLDATHASQVSFAIDAPGYLPEWKVDVTNDYYSRDVFVSATDGATVPGERWGLSINELVNWPAVGLRAAATAPTPREHASASARLRRSVEQ